MTPILIFLNGYYDYRNLDFYRLEIEKGIEKNAGIICADGGLQIFDKLNKEYEINLIPDILIGDLDSVNNTTTQANEIVDEWVGETDKDWTDGQLAVKYAIDRYESPHINIYGGLPKPDGYEIDHFLGNLKLMPFGYHHLGYEKPYKAEMRDPQQTIHYLTSHLRLTRMNSSMQRVSLIADEPNVVVEKTENLRWTLTLFYIHPHVVNALRNEFVEGADWVDIQLVEKSAPAYVIHNW